MDQQHQNKNQKPSQEDDSPYANLKKVSLSKAGQDTEPYGYQWPASRLSRHEMAKLTVVSNAMKRPLNQLIKEAVDHYADKLLDELGITIEQPPSHET